MAQDSDARRIYAELLAKGSRQLENYRPRKGPSLCLHAPLNRIVKTATKPMNALELVRRQLKREQALKEAQKATATTLCYRGNCYVKQV